MTRLQSRWMGVGLAVLVALYLFYPTFSWYQLPAAERARLEANRERPKKLVNLGLDLLGGTHLVYELDVSELPKDEEVSDAVARQIEVIRNRVDQYGVAEPLIARQGQRWIVVQLPGVKDPDEAKALIGQTAVLEFRMVDESEGGRRAVEKALETVEPFKDGKLDPEVAKLIPPGTQLMPGKESAYYLVRSTAPLTGSSLTNARVETGGEFGFPVVGFQFDAEGAKIFDTLTAANVGRNMAIILDGVVYSAPVIKSRIPGGSGIIEGNFQMEDARNLAIVLRAGALPVPMNVIEERTVGPSLGEDSINAGVRAALFGLLGTLVFMTVYYRLSGFVAALAVVLDILFVMAAMGYFRATLTLPGIAGLVLTIGMAVDANVLIFERIREEVRAGKPPRIALDAGYGKAFSAIIDSNITTLIAALFLFQFGTGPIKGFAVTLTVGILASLFTAIVVTRLVFDTFLQAGSVKELSV